MGCPYLDERGVGRHWCEVQREYVDDGTFNSYCYHSLDYHDCPSWDNHNHEVIDEGGSGARRAQGDNCYLTSACVHAKNLPDDCYELETLRRFRDGYLFNQPHGADDVAEYYRVAPLIVDAISHEKNSMEKWDDLYARLVSPCVRLIDNGQYREAYDLYKDISLGLQKEYLRA